MHQTNVYVYGLYCRYYNILISLTTLVGMSFSLRIWKFKWCKLESQLNKLWWPNIQKWTYIMSFWTTARTWFWAVKKVLWSVLTEYWWAWCVLSYHAFTKVAAWYCITRTSVIWQNNSWEYSIWRQQANSSHVRNHWGCQESQYTQLYFFFATCKFSLSQHWFVVTVLLEICSLC